MFSLHGCVLSHLLAVHTISSKHGLEHHAFGMQFDNVVNTDVTHIVKVGLNVRLSFVHVQEFGVSSAYKETRNLSSESCQLPRSSTCNSDAVLFLQSDLFRQRNINE